jgi:predicted DCC family thiol-disulfide oxidoreductase YuxK
MPGPAGCEGYALRTDIMIFDGVCHLCTRSVKFILAHESAPTLRFVPVQSAAGARMMREFGLSAEDARTFVLVVDGKPYVRSEAAIRVARYLRPPWRALGGIRVLPRAFRDWGYDVVARNRYQWFGQAESCIVPTPELRARFILE